MTCACQFHLSLVFERPLSRRYIQNYDGLTLAEAYAAIAYALANRDEITAEVAHRTAQARSQKVLRCQAIEQHPGAEFRL